MTARLRAVFAQELSHTLRRPLLWFLVAILLLLSWGMSTGDAQLSSGDASVGGTKAWITSEFSFAFILLALVTILYSFFLSIAAGQTVIQDDKERMGELLHSTPLRPGEYVWGKFLAILAGFLVALGLHVLFSMFFNHLVPNASVAEIRGPFQALNYLRPALVFALPALIFYAGVAFFLGERWRSRMPAYLFPIGIFLICGFFLWTWSPTWLDPRINRLLMLIDPSGFRWLNETWLKLDRGASFYNTARIGIDLPFAVSRLVFLGIGILGVTLSHRHVARLARGQIRTPRRLLRRRTPAPPDSPAVAAVPRPLAELGMRTRPAGRIEAALRVARAEAKELLSTPAIYLFGLLILLQTLGSASVELGSIQTPLLLTSGQLAVTGLDSLTLMLCLLLMFYTGQSLEREREERTASLVYSAPVPTASLLFGKVLGNSLVGVVVLAASFVGGAIALLLQGKVALDPVPFLVVWGLLLVPTLLVWTSFILAVHSVTGHRLVTYGVGLAVIAFTLYRAFVREMNWIGNWLLWESVLWTDMGPLQHDRKALVLSRLFALGLTALFTAVAVQAFGRRQADAVGTAQRLRRAPVSLLRLAPIAAVPLVIGIVLGLAVLDGFQGGTIEKKARDYWKQNLATWREAPQPALAFADVDVEIDPERRHFHTRGAYELVNDRAEPLARFALTAGPQWQNLKWTLRERPFEPENRSGLHVFPGPIPPGGRLRVGFEMEGRLPWGISKNGGGLPEFILPAGVVLTSFRPSFVPLIGYEEGIGVEPGENDYEPREYPDDHFRGQTDSSLGPNRGFHTRIRITGPADYTWNSVGTRVSEEVRDGRRSVVWESGRTPVKFFNVVGGRWQERRGRGTVIYHHPEHAHNVEAMGAALDAARRWYSEWFHPFPWPELKLSEFPGLANYAQGFPTNITFSEGIGFLAKPDERIDVVFAITAHEAAHQWWGNLLAPGKGPGGSILSEGMSHFSALLLTEQVQGPKARRELARRLEESYGDERHADAERPLVRIDNSREGDKTVTYDKGGWVFWMLLRHMGRDRALAGLRQFIHDWKDSTDHPVLQDFLASMRPFAADPAAFDAFARQWFHEVVVPEYELTEARKEPSGGRWRVTAKLRNAGTGRMPVEVAAVHGERDARITLLLGAGETRPVEILCPFEPERLVVDPDVHVLQLRRSAAVMELDHTLK